MSKLLELYKKMLATVGMVVDDQGFVSTLAPGADQSNPMMVGEKRLVLPYPEQLKEPDWSNRAGFHPLLQNFAGGDSTAMDAVRTRANRHLDFVIGMTFLNLAQLAANSEVHKSLKPEQARYLRPFGHANEKFVSIVKHIVVAKAALKKGFEFIRFSVPMGRQWKGQKRHRVAVATFPLYEQLPKDDKNCTIAGQKLSIKETKMMREMYQFLFPHIDEKGYYEFGSDSSFGPTIEALYGLFDIIITQHNEHIAALEGAIDATPFLYIPNEWREELASIPALANEIRAIPALDDNSTKARAAKTGPVTIVDAAPKGPAVQVTKSSAVPVINNQEVINQAVQQQQQQRQAFRRIGDDLSASVPASVDPRTQLPDDVGVAIPKVNLSGFKPTPTLGGFTNFTQPQQQQRQQPQYQVQPQGPSVTTIPENARMVNGAMYVPLDTKGVVMAPPNGSVILDGQIYVPFGAQGVQGQPVQMYQQQQQQGFGVPQQNITDPGQIKGLSPAEVQMYRNNPQMFAVFLQNMQATTQGQYAQQQMQRNEAPPYLQRLAEQAQQVQQRNRFGVRGY